MFKIHIFCSWFKFYLLLYCWLFLYSDFYYNKVLSLKFNFYLKSNFGPVIQDFTINFSNVSFSYFPSSSKIKQHSNIGKIILYYVWNSLEVFTCEINISSILLSLCSVKTPSICTIMNCFITKVYICVEAPTGYDKTNADTTEGNGTDITPHHKWRN